MLKKIFEKIEAANEEMISNRRWLHSHAEESFKEKETKKFIEKFYENMDVEIKTCGKYGVRVLIDTKKPGKTIALRADFDGLPIEEQTGLEFASKTGAMHACGHDGHTAYLLTLAKILYEVKDELKGKIVIVHQHAEETPPGGAKQMIEDGVLDGVDAIFGIHLMNMMQTGNVYYHAGETQHARVKFTVKFKGKGGHGSLPQLANDSIVAGAHFVTAIQTIVSRRVSPFDSAVLTIGSFDGKGTFNIIKESVTIDGDIRYVSEVVGEIFKKEVHTIANGIASTFGMDVDIEYTNDYPVLINDEKLTEIVEQAVSEAGLPVFDCGIQSPSEDFAYYAKQIPACFFYVGAKPEKEVGSHHSPTFDIDERSLEISAKAMASVVLKYLEV